jgi:DNA-binding transcriptional LysR family regulator
LRTTRSHDAYPPGVGGGDALDLGEAPAHGGVLPHHLVACLARAARELSVDHSTVGRRIEALEADVGVRLFTRTTSGYVLTPEAEELLPEIRRVESAVLALERAVHAREDALRGTVRLTAAEFFGSRYLAPRLAPFAHRHPDVTIELVTGHNVFDLARGEADVGVRLFRTNLDHLAVRRAGEIGYALYASEEYLRRRPPPRDPAELVAHDLVLDDVDQHRSAEPGWLERLACGARVAFATNSTVATLGATLGGLGIALLPRFLGDAEPALRHVPMPDEPVRGIWLTVHRDLRDTPRVRAVLDYLAEVIEADAPLLNGRP